MANNQQNQQPIGYTTGGVPLYESGGIASANQPQVQPLDQPQPQLQSPTLATQSQIQPIPTISPANTNNFDILQNLSPLESTVYMNALNYPNTQADINKLLAESQKLQTQYISALSPTAEINQLNQSLADVRDQANKIRQSYEAGVLNVEGQPIPMQFITGQTAQLMKQANLQLTAKQQEEANLLTRLGLAQEVQQTNLEQLKAGMGFLESNANLLMQARQIQANDEARALTVINNLNTQAREALTMILDSTTGLLFNQLPEATQQQLVSYGQRFGLDKTMISNMMELNKNNYDLDKATKESQIAENLATGGISQTSRANMINSLVATGLYTVPDATKLVDQIIGTSGISGGNNIQGGGISSVNVGGYDISTYATDPNHETSVQNILNNMGQIKTLDDVDNYIQSVAPGSPITSEMISGTSSKYGVSWEMLLAMMQQDSSLGTKGIGAKTFNPGNVGNTDSGKTTNYGSWQAGVDALGNWLNNHRATSQISEQSIQQAGSYVPTGNSIIDNMAQQSLTDRSYFESLSTTQQGIVMSALAKQNLKPADKTTSLTAEQIKLQGDAVSALSSLDQAEKLYNDSPALLWRNIGPDWLARWAGASIFRNLLKEVTDVKTRIRTGAALNAQEIDFYGSQAPKVGDSQADVSNKFAQLRGFYLGISGIPVTIKDPDTNEQYVFNNLYDSQQRLGLRQAINEGWELQY